MSGAWMSCAALLAGIGVACGAFGAHVLEDRLGEELLEVWRTAVLYHLVHALALLLTALVPAGSTPRARSAAVVAFTVGIVLFSGSLYVLALSGVRAWGAVTPFGGIAFLVGWGCLVRVGLGAGRS